MKIVTLILFVGLISLLAPVFSSVLIKNSVEVYAPLIDPANFVEKIDNIYFPQELTRNSFAKE